MQGIRESFGNLQAALKKRQQLNGQIIDIASKYMEHEQLVQLQVSDNQKGDLMALAQKFPELRANENFQRLSEQLEGVENEILTKREKYNAIVRQYNAYRASFPNILVAAKLSFDEVSYFDIDDSKFDAQARKFEKDDSEGLRNMISSGKESIKNTADRAVKGTSAIAEKGKDFVKAKVASLEGKHSSDGNGENTQPSDSDPDASEPKSWFCAFALPFNSQKQKLKISPNSFFLITLLKAAFFASDDYQFDDEFAPAFFPEAKKICNRLAKRELRLLLALDFLISQVS